MNYLATIERLPAVVSFHNKKLQLLDIFDGGKSSAATFALSSPFDGSSIIKRSRFEDVIEILSSAERTLHSVLKPL